MSADARAFAGSTRRPADFDAFWSSTLERLSRVPLNLTRQRSVLRSSPTIDVFEVRFRSFRGLEIFGWEARPVEPGPRPGLLILPGYSGSPGIPRAWAGHGFIALQISPRGHHLSDDEFAPGFPGLMTSGIDDPADYAYRGLYSDVIRGVDVLLGLPDVDTARVGVTGGSQGGGLSLIAAAFRPTIRACAADVPFLTAMRDALELGSSYPYEEVRDLLRLEPRRRDTLLATLDYFDTLNFADRITCPVLLSVGLRDDICPPQTAFALKDRLAGPVDLRVYPDGGHEGGGFTHASLKERWLRDILGAR